jgi:hypothetical protein
MLQYIHELPQDIQREDVTHAKIGRTIIDSNMLHAQVTYGTVNKDGEFQKDDLSGTHKLVVQDMEIFLASPSGMDTLPDTTEDLLKDSAAGLANYADAKGIWPGL